MMALIKILLIFSIFEIFFNFISVSAQNNNDLNDLDDLIRSYQTNWQIPTKNSPSNGIKSVKYSSLSRNSEYDSNFEPQLMRSTAYKTGSASQANSGSMVYNYQPGYFNVNPNGVADGSSASASSSSFSSSGIPCTSKPQPSSGSRMKCSGGKCEVSCLPDYAFPKGEDILFIVCMDGRWITKNFEYNEIPPCKAICNPGCLNKGICVAPGQCQCPENFMGPTCQFKKQLCLSSPPAAANSRRSCSKSLCSFTCMKGYKFPDGTQTINMQCIDGSWTLERNDLRTVPDCEPSCDPLCLNGGNCLSLNVCQCTKGYRGPQCQWSADRCVTTKMNFNGGFQCTGNADSLSCVLSCPKGINFEYPPAQVYTCRYETAEFQPKQVPKCIYAPGVQVIQSNPIEHYSQTYINGTKKGSAKKKIIVEEIEEGDGETEEEVEETIITTKKKTVKKKKGSKTYTIDEDEEFFEAPGVYSLYTSEDLEVTYKIPRPKTCMTWNGNKIKTFDGVQFTHELICSHTLVQDIDGTFSIILRACPYESIQPCAHALEIFTQSERFTFEKSVDGRVKMFTTKKEIPIPVQMTGLRVTLSGLDVRVLLEQIPITITWNSEKFVQIDATESLWNKTSGVCGTLDGIMSNDFTSKDGKSHKLASTFVDSWRALEMDKNKAKCFPRASSLTSLECETSIEEKANLLCTDLLANPKMKNCFKMFREEILMKNCISDFCYCKNTLDPVECICNGITALAKDCRFRGIMLEDGWRDWQICPLNCTNGRVYKSCGPVNENHCGSAAIESDSFNCREGCFCPDGTLLSDGVCVKKEQCPCILKGKAFPPQSKIRRDCNTCTCESGNWKCSTISCGSRCAVIGDPHYITFDGKRYDFMGKCSYYLMKTEKITIEAENVACSGAISESLNFLPSISDELPSCTKSLTIKFNDATQSRIIKLKQSKLILLDGAEVTKLPWDSYDGIVKIRQASTTFVVVDFKDGAKIWWDGMSRAYVDVPASYRGKTQGLCGTFNSNSQDDFLTPEGDIETTVHSFANKWQTKDSCDYLNDKIVAHPCQVNVENRAKAEKICSKLRDKLFAQCHLFVEPEAFYEDCMYDVCACNGEMSNCFCPIFASYATECARQGIVLNDWRYKIPECAISCPNGQVFEQCGGVCKRTCYDFQTEVPCKLLCAEGCWCPKGQVLNDDGECVTISMCNCLYKGMEFKPGYKEVRPGRKYLELCTCQNARWSCVEAKTDDSTKYPAASDMTSKCSAVKNEVFTTCEPVEPLTCKNMHLNITSMTTVVGGVCRAGCKCKDGYVLDTILKQCVLPENCSCHHGGKSYSEGEKINEDCNTCSCKAGKWDCTTKACASTCSVWGDSHFTTFDGREFDFQGVCSYVLSKGKLSSDEEGFSVSIQNVLCGSNGVTCSKSLEIHLSGNEMETISLSSDQVMPAGIKHKLNEKPLNRIVTYHSGIFLVVEIAHIGFLLKWDRGTRVYLKLENRWKGKVQGLCGNYNKDNLDDFMNPSNGVESSPIVFGHSWKLEDSCQIPTEQVDACKLNPQRQTWAQKKCGMLKSSPSFIECHSEVPFESFYKRCIFDACSCDSGGDCECLCTALSAYAYSCASKGIFIKWRTPDLCPMQCDPVCSNYSPCVASCPPDTCDNLMDPLKTERLCNSETCVEGCKLKECPIGSVYSNSSYLECVPKSSCKPLCLMENGIVYYEGDVMASDACHSCICSRGSKICSGVPCTIAAMKEADLSCTTGWTEWFNQDILDDSQVENMKTSKSNYFKEGDFEPLPNNLQMKNLGGAGKTFCTSDNIAAIECRSVVTHQHPKNTGQNVECSTEKGLVCQGQCFDYEIRVYCDCGENNTNTSTKPKMIMITTTKQQATLTSPKPPTTPSFSTSILPIPIVPTLPSGLFFDCDEFALRKHPSDCHQYLQCFQQRNGTKILVERSCGPAMMFNPRTLTCEWPVTVQIIRPECARAAGKPTTDPSQPEESRNCPNGFVWSDCAIPCGRACNYYKRQLLYAGNCTASSSDCIPGCLPEGSITKCESPMLWRDWKSCVSVEDCTCFGPNNEILKPGSIVHTSDCLTCQCIRNEYICAKSSCTNSVSSTTSRPSPGIISSTINRPSYLKKMCDPSIPHVEHPNSCYKFLHCSPSSNGSYFYAVKTCYPDMMFNPNSMVCDWPTEVKRVKPQCLKNPGEIEIEEAETISIITTDVGSSSSAFLINPKCNPIIPLVEHPESCHKYLACERNSDGSFSFVEKVCSTNLMFNPKIQVCDWKSNVLTVKPACGLETLNLVTASPALTTTKTSSLLKIVSSTTTVSNSFGGEAAVLYVPYLTFCDPKIPHIEHPNSCYKFLHCQPASNGSFMYAVKTCYPDMMFNPATMICDWPSSVMILKPKCKSDPGEIDLWEMETKFVTRITQPPQTSTTTNRITQNQKTEKIPVSNVKVPILIQQCDLTKRAFKEHPSDCHLYLECMKIENGSSFYIEKSCGEKMFNVFRNQCESVEIVSVLRPECDEDWLNLISTEAYENLKTTTTTTPRIISSTLTPPKACNPDKMIPLIESLPDSAFSASSILGEAFKPQYSKFSSRPIDKNGGSWAPKTSNLNQYLEIAFPQVTPIYGFKMKGNRLFDQYVTSFKVLFTVDDITYHVYEGSNKQVKIFSGPLDARTPVMTVLKDPFEAKRIRFYPITWKNAIAMQVEVMGCENKITSMNFTTPFVLIHSTSTVAPLLHLVATQSTISKSSTVRSITEFPIEPICDDPLGVQNNKIQANQITFSSIKDSGSVKAKIRKNPLEIIKLSSQRGWIPLSDNTNEFIMFDFTGNRNLTGIITKGGEYGWVKSFMIQYSKDNVIWNKLLDDYGKPREFLANYDSETEKRNLFKTPINAQFLKIQPLKWHSAIELKIEPLGCFLPYPVAREVTSGPKEEVEIITPSSCLICKGVLKPKLVDADSCVCNLPLYWSGSECVPQSQCPCMEGHISYEIGETYQTEDCSDCICKIGGVPDCKPKVCTPCKKGFRRELPNSCSCKCVKCPEDTILCETSGECIAESSWCDGIQDCPDDEKNCLVTEKPTIHINKTETITITKKCPDPVCPPGYIVKPKRASRKSKMMSRFSDGSDDDENDENDKPQHQYYYVKQKFVASYEAILPISTSANREDINSEECFEFICVPTIDESGSIDYAEGDPKVVRRCPSPKCPQGYMIRLQIQKDRNQCANFSCEPQVENDAVCNVTGRTFQTFDTTEFKFDICSHLLARDVNDEKWNVIMRKSCSSGNNICSKELEIKDKVSKYTLILYTSLNVNLDGHSFTVEQLQNANSNRKMSFTVSKNGDNLLYISHPHGIWITFDQYGDVKLGVSAQYAGKIDGLCGFFNNEKSDDKRKPTGEIAHSTVEFGNAWSVSTTNNDQDCEPHVCPKVLQDEAWTICNKVNDEIFKPCHASVDPTKFISRCLETACDCLLTSTNGSSSSLPSSISDLEKLTKTCKCSMLKNYVVECLAADDSISLETWRSVHSCEATCPSPFIHQDCFRRKCETTCSNLQSSDCGIVSGSCFSGCYCPSGSVREGSTCIPMSECRDCVCDGFGKSQYLTYDRKNFTFDGNCTYLLTRDVTIENVHTFEIYTTIGPCLSNSSLNKATCTQAFHIAFGSHIIHIQKISTSSTKALDITVDGLKVNNLPFNQDWIKMNIHSKELKILFPQSQVEVSSIFESMTFSIKVPSIKYGNKMEGICGNCNGNPDDDMLTNPAATTKTSTNEITPLKAFAMSWLADNPKLALNEDKDTCYVDDEANCLPLPPETDPCFRIYEDEVFEKCHFVVDPIMYITACQQDLCRTGPTQKGSCETIAAYARECARNGVCIDWRNKGFCTMDCPAPFVYKSCGCSETCSTLEKKEQLIHSSSAVTDPVNLAKLKSICSTALQEGCFCPEGTVLHNGKCLRDTECKACDDKGHLPGDKWKVDSCTTCTCRNDSTIFCSKTSCPTKPICGLGFVAVKAPSTDECCEKYVCVAEVARSVSQTACPQLNIPKCSNDQTNKMINDTNGCSKFICDCIPKDQCKPLVKFTELNVGYKVVMDTSGCCPIAKLTCDKSLCPSKLTECKESFYQVEKTKTSDDKICCDEYKCLPPKDYCIATNAEGKKVLKPVKDKWQTEDVCIKAQCLFDENGIPTIFNQSEICNVICQAGEEYRPIVGKCCGECVKTKCVVDNMLYEIGALWKSEDNCTTFTCNIKDEQTYISSMMETCPDISKCPPLMRYRDGCCDKCRLETLSLMKHNCNPETLSETMTVGLIQIQLPIHGKCRNLNPIRGVTQCSGSCKSGTKFDPVTLHQLKDCDCCSVSGVVEMQVELVCEDDYKLLKNFNIPSSCSCSKCSGSEAKLLKLKASS